MVALLRAINLGARNRVPMGELRAALDAGGYPGARTLLQSGNVVLDTDDAPDTVAADVRAIVAHRFGVDSPAVVRTADEWRDVVEGNPLPVPEPRWFQVVFFPEPPDVGDLDGFGEERAVVRAREIYCWHPAGLHRSPLGRALDRLGGTGRNWNTVGRIAALL